MDKQEKEFVLNKGLILGLVLMLFPIIDLILGLNMSDTNYFLIFIFSWIVIYSFLILKWSKEFAFKYDVFSFKDSFRVLYIISALGFTVLTVGKIGLWNVYSSNTYIKINLNRAQKALDEANVMFNSENDLIVSDSLKNNVSDSSDLVNLNNKRIFINKFLEPTVDYWKNLELEGISKTHFINILIQVLFLNSIYCAILALFVRKKEQFIKTN